VGSTPWGGIGSAMKQILTCALVFAPECTVAYLNGELDGWTAECVVARLGPLVASGHDVVVNVSGLSFVGTTGLVLLDRLGRCAARKGGSLCLEDPSTAARRLLEVTGLGDHFTIRAGGTLSTA
jgi:anti-sigma B factor antagonist